MLQRRCSRFRLIGALVAAWLGLTGVVAGASASAASTEPATQLLVRFAPGTSDSDAAAAEQGAGATHVGDVYGLGVRILHVPSDRATQALDALQHNPHVDYAEPDAGGAGVDVIPNDSYWSGQWGPAKVNAPAAWTSTTGTSSTVVAMLDSGIDYSHPEFAGRTVPGYDFVNNDADPSDDLGHGTSTAGIANATGNNAIGIAGMCWQCSIMPVKVLDSSNFASWANVSSGITWATDHGARVISLSITGTSGSTTMHDAIVYAVNKGALVVAAAGNTGTTNLGYPAAYSEVLSVAATDSSDHLYSFSTYGDWVNVAAPGCNTATKMGGGYGSFCGTSSATPIVSGIAAMAFSANPSATPTDVRNAIQSSATPVGSFVHYGRVDAAGTLTAVGSTASTTPPPVPTPTPTTTTTTTWSDSLTKRASSKSYRIDAGAGSLSVTLAPAKGVQLTVTVTDSTGAVVTSATGSSRVTATANVTAGQYVLTVGVSARASFTMTATYTTP